MATSCVGRKVTGAGFILIGLMVWVAAAIGRIVEHPEVAFLGVPLGGMLTMGGLALSFTSGRRIAARYFEEMEEVARTPKRCRRRAEFPPPVGHPEKAGASGLGLLAEAEPAASPQ
jgi:hypothetical protein